MGIKGHGTIIIYTSEGKVVYCNTHDTKLYIDILKKVEIVDILHINSMCIVEWEEYSILLDRADIDGESYNIAHILPRTNNVDETTLYALRDYIEASRSRLDNLILESTGGNLSTDIVLEASEELDQLINLYMDIVVKRKNL